VRLYGNDAFCLVLAQKLALELVSPPDDLLLRLPPGMLQRDVRGETLAGPPRCRIRSSSIPTTDYLRRTAAARSLRPS
jgi:hypothetical protein